MRKIEAQVIGRDERAGLLHVRAENVAQGGVHQVRRGVVAHVARAANGIGHGGDAIADVEIFFRDDSVRDEAADRIVGAFHFGELERHVVVVERAGVGHLAAGFGVDGGAVENDFGFVARLDFVYLALFGDDAFDARIARLRAEVKIGLGLECFVEFQIDGTGCFFVRTFPGSAARVCAALPSRGQNPPSQLRTRYRAQRLR